MATQQEYLIKHRFGLIKLEAEHWKDTELKENSARLNCFKSVYLVVSASLARHRYNYLALASHYSEVLGQGSRRHDCLINLMSHIDYRRIRTEL